MVLALLVPRCAVGMPVATAASTHFAGKLSRRSEEAERKRFEHATRRLATCVSLDHSCHLDCRARRVAAPAVERHQHVQSRRPADDAHHAGVVTCQLAGCLRYVERHDGGHDAPVGDANSAHICCLKPKAGRRRSIAVFCSRLSRPLDCIRCYGSHRSMGAPIGRLALVDDREQFGLAQRSSTFHCGSVSVHTAQACLLARMSLAARLSYGEWQEGLVGAWRMGIRHGLYCLGCCWALMALLFVGGVMNILWIAALAALVAIEKLAPKGEQVAQLLGFLMIGAGILTLAWPAVS